MMTTIKTNGDPTNDEDMESREKRNEGFIKQSWC